MDKNKIKRMVDVVIVSPLSRALETAVGAFGGPDKAAEDGSLLMRALTAEEACPFFTSGCCKTASPAVTQHLCRGRAQTMQRCRLKESRPLLPGRYVPDHAF